MNALLKTLLMLSTALFMATAWSEEKRYTYYENDGVYIYYETQNSQAYRELLPAEFDMPDELLVYSFISDFYKMDARTEPYKEAAIFLLAEKNDKKFWHCVFMPVTSQESRIAGVRRLGLPKSMGEIEFTRTSPVYQAYAIEEDGYEMSLTVDTHNHEFSDDEEKTIAKLSALPKYSLLNGELIQIGRTSKRSIVDLAKLLSKKLVLKSGTGDIKFKQPQAQNSDAAHPLDLVPSKVLASYYLKNSIPFRLNGRPVK